MEENTNATAGGIEAGAENATGASNGPGQKTYTQEEYEKELQAHTDKRVTEALKTAQAKWEKELEARLEAERNEAAERAKMTAEERARADAEKAQKQFEQERQQYRQEKMEFETAKQLAEKGLPVGFAATLCGKDAEQTQTNITLFEKEFNMAVEAGITEKLKGKPPKAPAGQEADPFLQGFAGN